METTICENCGKKAIKMSTGIVLTSYPPQYPMIYKCGCGWTKEAEIVRGQTEEEMFQENWNNINK